MFTCAIMTLLVLPHHPVQPDTSESQGSMLTVLKIPGVLVCTFGICATSASIGFISATLEPHLRQFELSAVKIGVMFIINGGVYAISAPFVGMIVDKCKTPKIASIIGSFCIIIGFSLVGECRKFEDLNHKLMKYHSSQVPQLMCLTNHRSCWSCWVSCSTGWALDCCWCRHSLTPLKQR